MWRVCKEAGRPWPSLSDDDVIDYMVMEAVALKANKEEQDEQKKAERKAAQREERERLKKLVG
jgi:hypothetical protein